MTFLIGQAFQVDPEILALVISKFLISGKQARVLHLLLSHTDNNMLPITTDYILQLFMNRHL